jgi:hypothetical protein
LYPAIDTTGGSRKKHAPKAVKSPKLVVSDPLASNTHSATPWKSALDKGKGKLVKSKKPEVFQLLTGGALKIGGEPRKPKTSQLRTFRPLKMEGKVKKHEAPPS